MARLELELTVAQRFELVVELVQEKTPRLVGLLWVKGLALVLKVLQERLARL